MTMTRAQFGKAKLEEAQRVVAAVTLLVLPPEVQERVLAEVDRRKRAAAWRPCDDCRTPLTCEENQDLDRCP